MKSFSKASYISTSIKWASVPIIFAALLRYAPGHFYGNKRVLDKPIKYEIQDDFLSESDVLSLREWVFNERRFATVINAAARGVQSIGEDEPVNPDGSCSDMTFTATETSPTCKYTGRSDIAQHFIKTGGHRGMKETPEKLISSTLSFINYYPDKVNDPEIKRLFENKEYLRKVGNICHDGWGTNGPRKEGDFIFRPTQVNIVLVPPGQDLPLHQDNQWYWGINQLSQPDWILHTIQESGLYKDKMIPQAQGVAYLHGTKEKPYYENGGEYVFFPYGPGADALELKPKRGQAILMDGGRMIHGVARTAPGYQVAAIDKDLFNRIEYQGNNTWYLLSDDELIDVFKTEDLRMTFVWRGLCFHDEAEKSKFEQHLKDEDYVPQNKLLKQLEEHMHETGRLSKSKNLENMSRKEFATTLFKKYLQYPLDTIHTAWFPFNYCAASFGKPWLKVLLSPFCVDRRERVDLSDQYPPAKEFCVEGKGERYQTNCNKL
ncbi:unnamed protein product [Oikopleura dioica]|uniref:Uncharacterized protein n=1 Tax=Oikopleura dioica TaxID=34765 RepID=E4YIR7_OIKDI|nr:unnamed protein product [Oikopleura dioica]